MSAARAATPAAGVAAYGELVERVTAAAGHPAELAVVVAALYVRTDELQQTVAGLAARLAALEGAQHG